MSTAPAVVEVADAESMRELGQRLAKQLQPGDLVVLSGELGAGKTTLAQGLGVGLNIRGPVTSPTFVIARVHPSLADGPPLVHVDAYRLGGWDELEDLDLEATLDEAVTIVEWGEGLVEGLSADRLDVRIHRAAGGSAGAVDALAEDGAEDRTVELHGVGQRWHDVPLP